MLSSCKTEFYAVVDGASRALGMQMAEELGIMVKVLSVEMMTESSGAKSFASKGGSGRVPKSSGSGCSTRWLM